MAAATDGSVTDGRRLHEVLQEWSVRWVQNEMPGYFSNARTVVLGPDHARTVGVLREFTDNIELQHLAPGIGSAHASPRARCSVPCRAPLPGRCGR